MRYRIAAATLIAALLWGPATARNASAIYCYPGDPPEVYQACVEYNRGIGQQVQSEKQMVAILRKLHGTEAQINAIYGIITSLQKQIAAQNALIAQTQAKIDDLDRQIRFAEGDLTRLQAHMSVRDQLLNQRLRYVDAHGSINYVELVLTASTFNDIMNRMIGAQQIAASDRRLLDDLRQEHLQFEVASATLATQRSQVAALLQQQKATEADLEKNQATMKVALAYQQQLEDQLNDQYRLLTQQRAQIDAQVAQLQLKYQAAARAAGGGTGQFEWPEPACGFGCISQPFGCSTFWAEPYWAACPYPHKIHTGLDIAGPYGTPIVAADTGIIYAYPGSFGYGNYVVMIHGNGYSTLYGHLSSFARGIRSGQIVARGDLIAYEGSTGNSTGPHVHFEIRVNNVWKDPCLWLGC